MIKRELAVVSWQIKNLKGIGPQMNTDKSEKIMSAKNARDAKKQKHIWFVRRRRTDRH
jgi:hypothetical protein